LFIYYHSVIVLKSIFKQSQKQSPNSKSEDYLGQPATVTDRQGRERLLKETDTCVGAGGGHFERSQWQWNSGIWSLG